MKMQGTVRNSVFVAVAFASACVSVCRAEDAQLERAKLELVVDQAGEMLADANRKGSSTHGAVYQYYFGLIYASGTNLLARKDSLATKNLRREYLKMVEKNYEAYTKVEKEFDRAAATGPDRVHVGRRVVTTGTRHRAKRIANAEKLGDKELAEAVRKWEAFVIQLKKTR